MKNILIPFLFLNLLSIEICAAEKGWQRIENTLYSLVVPSDWEPRNGSPRMEPGRREARGFELRYLAWNTPIRKLEDMPKTIGLDIQSYRKLDDGSITISELEKLTIFNVRSREVLFSSDDELRLSILKDSREMDGSIEHYRKFYLMRRNGKQIHQLYISLTEEHYRSNPEIKDMIKKILDSFTVKTPRTQQ